MFRCLIKTLYSQKAWQILIQFNAAYVELCWVYSSLLIYVDRLFILFLNGVLYGATHYIIQCIYLYKTMWPLLSFVVMEMDKSCIHVFMGGWYCIELVSCHCLFRCTSSCRLIVYSTESTTAWSTSLSVTNIIYLWQVWGQKFIFLQRCIQLIRMTVKTFNVLKTNYLQ